MSSGPEDQWDYNWQEPRVCFNLSSFLFLIGFKRYLL